jgi:hypothetical protein
MGIILFVLAHGCALWDEPTGRSPEFVSFVAARYDGCLSSVWETMHIGMRELLLQMLELPISRRISLNGIKKHPWTNRHNRFYNEDTGQCVSSATLLESFQMHLEEEDTGSSCWSHAFAYSQPEIPLLASSTPSFDRISWFSQPTIPEATFSLLLVRLCC